MAKKLSGIMARPKLEIDDDQVYKLAKLGCTNVEMADFFGCGEATIRERFRDIISKGRADCHLRLRQLQWKSAEAGNVTMQIFLGKAVLGQKDVQTVDHNIKKDSKLIINLSGNKMNDTETPSKE